jgi:hypothetical protein
MKQTAFERREFVLAKIAIQWSKNNKSVSAAVTAAGEIGRAHIGNLVRWERADRAVRGGLWSGCSTKNNGQKFMARFKTVARHS